MADLGRPKATRAVGNACAHNPAPLIIPCHRVVPASGGIGAYSGGKGPVTKRKLLELEGVDASSGLSGSRPESNTQRHGNCRRP